MIEIFITRHHHLINDVLITGHAHSQDQQDLVCAGVSAIVFGMLNAIDQQAPASTNIVVNNNHIQLQIRQHDVIIDTILTTLIIQLTTIAQKFSKNVNISNIVK